MLIITNPCTCLPCKIVRDDICFSRSIFCDRVRGSATPSSMESVDEWNEVTSPEATSEVKMIQQLLHITMNSAQWKGDLDAAREVFTART